MSKQTVEEAAQSRWPISDDLSPSDLYTFEMFHLLFKDGAAWQKEQDIEWLLNSLPSEDTGRKGCTYNDTEYDSLSVVYGYNLALEHIKSALSKLKKDK